MTDRRVLEEIYAVALDEWEFGLFGTRSHMAASERHRSQHYRQPREVFCPHSLLIVSMS